MSNFWDFITWPLKPILKWLQPDVEFDEDPIEGVGSRTWRDRSSQIEGPPRPRNYGKNLHHGNIIARWTSVDGSEREILHMILDHGDGPTKGIGDNIVYINDQPYTSYGDVTIQERLGTMEQTCMTGFEKLKLEYGQNTELLYNKTQTFITPNDFFDDIEFTIMYPNGMIRNMGDGGTKYTTVDIEIKIRPVGGSWEDISPAAITRETREPFFKQYSVNTLSPGRVVKGTQYELSYKKLSADTTDRFVLDATLRSVREVSEIAYTYPGRALLGITAVATDRLSGSLNIKVVREDRIIYNLLTGDLEYCNNRASVTWDILTQPCISGDGDGGGEGVYAIERYDGLDPSNLDPTFFTAWATFCDVNVDDGYGGTEHRCDCNIKVKEFTNIFDLAHKIAEVGRAHLYYSDKLTGWIEQAVATPIDLVTMDSIMPGTWSNAWAIASELPGVIKVMYIDEKQGYERTSADDAMADAGGFRKIKEFEGVGLTSRGAAWHYAHHLLTRNKLIRNVNQFQVHKEGFRYKLGDVIRLQNRPANWGKAFRVMSATADTITVDRNVEDEVSPADALYIRTYDGAMKVVRTEDYIVDSVSGRVITVTINWAVTPIKGNQVAVGTTKLRRIKSIDPSTNNYFDVVVETYDVALYDSDDADPANPNVNYIWPGPVLDVGRPVTWKEMTAYVNRVLPIEPSHDIPLMSNCTWSGNDVDTVSWANTDGEDPIMLRIKGVLYEIAADNTTDSYIYWDPGAENQFSTTNLFSDVTTAILAGGWCMAFNIDGVVHSAQPFQIIHGGLIQAGTLTAEFGQIGALAVGAANIQDLAILPEHLVASNFTNLIQNPGFEAGDVVWTKPTDGIIYESASSRTGAWMARATGVGSRVFTSNKFYVIPGEKYHMSAWMMFSATFAATGSSGVDIYWYTAADVYVSGDGVNLTPSTSWQEASKILTVPATAAYGMLRIRAYSMTAGYMYCDDALVIRQAQTDDIEEGAITAASEILADNAVVQAKLADLAVGTTKLANLAVSEGKIAALAVTSAKIGLLAVEYGNIKDLAVDTLKIANNAVTIPVSAYTAGSITVQTSYTTVQSLVIEVAADVPVWISFTCTVINTAGQTEHIDGIKILRTVGGTPTTIYDNVPAVGISILNNFGIQLPVTFTDIPGAAVVTYSIQLDGSTQFSCTFRSMFAIAVKK